jgi:hypothetical protein
VGSAGPLDGTAPGVRTAVTPRASGCAVRSAAQEDLAMTLRAPSPLARAAAVLAAVAGLAAGPAGGADGTFPTSADAGGPSSVAEGWQLPLDGTDTAALTVRSVAPTVDVTGDAIAEGSSATITAAITDPGLLATHTAAVDWGDGLGAQAVGVEDLAVGVSHVYGDNGDFTVTVTVTDQDGGVGANTAMVTVENLDPVLDLDTGGAISFPGGDHLVVDAGVELALAAAGDDQGSDDLAFDWSTGDGRVHHNDGADPDPFPSPGPRFPFAAADSVDALFMEPGVEEARVTVSDDDAGSDQEAVGVIVLGTAERTRGSGWWQHEFSGAAAPHLDGDLAAAYLEIVAAVSSVFSEQTALATFADAHAALAPAGGDRRAGAEAALLLAWLHFASGAVPHDATVSLASGPTDFLVLMFAAEETILTPAATDSDLELVERELAKVRRAHGP